MPPRYSNGPDKDYRPVVYRDILSLRQDIQSLNTHMQVMNTRLNNLENVKTCPGGSCTTADFDPNDIRCVQCPHNPDVLPPLPDDHVV